MNENVDLNINSIRKLVSANEIIWRGHILVRMKQRGIRLIDVIDCLLSGEIIEEYLEDYPYPSCLILGYTDKHVGLHVVCGVGQGKVWMITSYYPDEQEWYADLKSRRR